MGIISKITSYVPIVNKIKSVYSVGKKIRNYIYTRRNFAILIRKHNSLLKQLEAANEVAMFYGRMQEECVGTGPVVCRNFNKAYGYCYEYGLPLDPKHKSIESQPLTSGETQDDTNSN